eukprot:7389510-Prymnesium_polylepis.1
MLISEPEVEVLKAHALLHFHALRLPVPHTERVLVLHESDRPRRGVHVNVADVLYPHRGVESAVHQPAYAFDVVRRQ